jgi:hypothetical protein
MHHLSRRLILPGIFLFAIALPIIPAYGNLDTRNTDLNNVPIGGAYVVFAGKTGGEIKKSELMGQTEVRVDGCAKGYRIMTYTLEITSGKSKSTYQSNSNQLTKEMQSKLQSLAKGDTFEFKLMKAHQEEKHIVDVHGGKFTVV